jgi:uncharacterized protein (UPF0332 family)
VNLEQQQLIAKAEDSLRAAKLLLESKLYDVAVSRAYYAMFYIAEAFLLSQDLSFSKHAAVISKFGECFAKTGQVPKEFHRYLIQAQEARTRADYDATTTVQQPEARAQIERAEAFLTLANQQLA